MITGSVTPPANNINAGNMQCYYTWAILGSAGNYGNTMSMLTTCSIKFLLVKIGNINLTSRWFTFLRLLPLLCYLLTLSGMSGSNSLEKTSAS